MIFKRQQIVVDRLTGDRLRVIAQNGPRVLVEAETSSLPYPPRWEVPAADLAEDLDSVTPVTRAHALVRDFGVTRALKIARDEAKRDQPRPGSAEVLQLLTTEVAKAELLSRSAS